MRILVALLVVAAFGAMLLFDTAALLRLTAACVAGGCGVSPLWIAIGAAAIAAALALLPRFRRPRFSGRVTGAARKAPSRPSPRKQRKQGAAKGSTARPGSGRPGSRRHPRPGTGR
jgi:hypothetical protein